MIKLTQAKSSNIGAHGYDHATKTLVVQFTSGSVYHYHDVPADVADAFVKSGSLGSYFSREIRGKFKHTQIKETA